MKNKILNSKIFNIKNIFICIVIIWFILLMCFYFSFIPKSETIEDHTTNTSISQEDIVNIKVEEPILADTPAIPSVYTLEHPGTKTQVKNNSIIDYSNAKNGYIMINCTNSISAKIKSQVHGPNGTVYTYDVPYDKWIAFPLSDRNGEYTITVLKNTTGNKYAILNSVKFAVELKDEFGPFLYSNQYVNYEYAINTIDKAKELIGKETDTLKKVEIIYDYVVKNFTYDYDKAKTVKSGYLPVLDDVLAFKKGICFDYASLMAGMLRSQNVPCKLVVGYAGTAYHAWISVYSEKLGWIDGAIYFDGNTWQRLDPTFASSGNNSQAILDYIKNNDNYKVKYLY